MAFIFIYGRPGSGKTTLASTMTKLGYEVTILDVDNKVKEMLHLNQLVKEEKIKVLPITSNLVTNTLEGRINDLLSSTNVNDPRKVPKGYIEYCEYITTFENQALTSEKDCENPQNEDKKEKVLVCDSLTTLLEHLQRYILFKQKKSKFSYDEWAIWKTNIEDFLSIHNSLQRMFKHVIIISHEVMERDELIGKIEILPMIDGSMKHKIGKYFSEVYHTFVTSSPSGKVSYNVATKPIDRAEARTSRNLDTIENACFTTLFKEEYEEYQSKQKGVIK